MDARRISVVVDASAADLQKAAAQSVEALQAIGKETVKQTSVTSDAGDKTIRTNAKVSSSYGDMAVSVTRSYAGITDKAVESAKIQAGALRDVQLATARTAEATEAMAARSTVAFGKSEKSAKSAAKGFGTASSELTRFGKMTVLGLGAAAAVAVDFGIKFQKSQLQLQTQAGASTKQVAELSKGTLAMAGKVGATPDQLSAGMYHVVSSMNAVIPPAQRVSRELAILKEAAMGAAVGGSNLQQTAYVLSSAMNSLGTRGKDASRVMADLNAIVGAGDMHMQDLVGAMSTGLIPAASSFGISLRSVGAALDYMVDRGTPATMAATRLRMSMTLLAAPTQQSAKMLGALGMSSDDVKGRTEAMTKALKDAGLRTTDLSSDLRKPDGLQVALLDLSTHLKQSGLDANASSALIARAFGGGRSGTAIIEMIGHLDQLGAKYRQVGKDSGDWGMAWSKTTHSLAFEFKQLEGSVSATATKVGLQLQPTIKSAIVDLKDAVSWVEKNKTALTALEAVVVGVAGIAILSFATSLGRKFASMVMDVGRLGKSVATLGGRLGSSSTGAGGTGSSVTGGGIGGMRSGPGLPGSPENPLVVTAESGSASGLGSKAEDGGNAPAVGGKALGPTPGIAGGLILGAGSALADEGETQGPNSSAAAEIMKSMGFTMVNGRWVKKGAQAKTSTASTTIPGPVNNFSVPSSDVADIRAYDELVKTTGTDLAKMTPKQLDALRAATERLAKDGATGISGLQKQLALLAKDPSYAKVQAAFAKTGSAAGENLSSIRAALAQTNQTILNTVVPGSAAAKQALATNFETAAQDVQTSMQAGVISTQTGIKEINRLLIDALKSLGDNKQAASFSAIQNTLGTIATITTPHAAQGFLAGSGLRDSVPIMAAPGEAVLNRHQQPLVNAGLQAIGINGLPDLFSRVTTPHYMASGGFVAEPGTNFTAGVEPQIAGDLGKLGRLLGVMIEGISGYRSPAHSVEVGGFGDDPHTRGEAADIMVPGNFLSSGIADADLRKVGLFRPFYPASAHEINHVQLISGGISGSGGGAGVNGGGGGSAAAAIAKVAPKLKQVIAKGAGGIPGSLAQAALSMVQGAAQSKLNKSASSTSSGGPSGPVPAGSVKQWLSEALHITGHYSATNLSELYARAMFESSGNPHAINNYDRNAQEGHPSKGLLQTIDSTFQTYEMPGHTDIWNPVDNAIAAIRYMYARYGHVVGNTGVGYAGGGIVTDKASTSLKTTKPGAVKATPKKVTAAVAKVDSIETQIGIIQQQYDDYSTRYQDLYGGLDLTDPTTGAVITANVSAKAQGLQNLLVMDNQMHALREQQEQLIGPLDKNVIGAAGQSAARIKHDQDLITSNKRQLYGISQQELALAKPEKSRIPALDSTISSTRSTYAKKIKALQTKLHALAATKKNKSARASLTSQIDSLETSEQSVVSSMTSTRNQVKAQEDAKNFKIASEKNALEREAKGITHTDASLTADVASWKKVAAGKTADLSDIANIKSELGDPASYGAIYNLDSDILSLKQQLAQVNGTVAVTDTTDSGTSDTGTDDSTLIDLLQQQAQNAAANAALSEADLRVLAGFIPQIPAYAHGGRVAATGLALVHEGEWVSPNPRGAYGSQVVAAQGAQTVVHQHTHIIEGDMAGLVKTVRTVTDSDMHSGRTTRALATRLRRAGS